METVSRAERTRSKAVAGGPSEVADCGVGWAKLQLAGEAAAGGPREVVDCGTGQARLQLADPARWKLAYPAAPHSHIDKPGGMVGKQSRLRNPGLQLGEIKPQTSD